MARILSVPGPDARPLPAADHPSDDSVSAEDRRRRARGRRAGEEDVRRRVSKPVLAIVPARSYLEVRG